MQLQNDKKYTMLNKIDKYYDRPTTSAVVSMADSSVYAMMTTDSKYYWWCFKLRGTKDFLKRVVIIINYQR